MEDDPVKAIVGETPFHLGRVDVNVILRDLLEVGRVALGPSMPDVSEEEARALLAAVLPIVERTMPPGLQRQDKRVALAHSLRNLLEGDGA